MSLTAAKRKKISDAILILAEERGPTKTFCPSDAARQVFAEDQWRDEMDNVRHVAQSLIKRGVIEATQKGKVIPDAENAHGPIRLRQKRR